MNKLNLHKLVTNLQQTAYAMSPLDMKNDEMSPMVKILADLNQSGYTTQFKACEKGVTSMDTQKCYKPKEVEVKHFYRFEGESSPDDNSIIYAIETKNGEKGTLIDSYGAYSDPMVEDFIKKVKSIEK
jgi:hypothetical protein